MLTVIKLKITKELMDIYEPRWLEIEDGKEVEYRVRQVRNTNGFYRDYLVKVDDEGIFQDVLGIENEEFRTRIVEELERIRTFNKKNREQLMDSIGIFDLIKRKLGFNN